MNGEKGQRQGRRTAEHRPEGLVSVPSPRFEGLGGVSRVASHLEEEVRTLQEAEARLSRAWAQRQGMCRRAVADMEADRRFVSRQLHEEIGPMLAALKFAVEEKRRKGGAEESGGFQEIADALAAAVREVRRIAAQLRPVILDDLGLIATLTWFLRRFESKHADVRVSKDFSLEEYEIPERLKIFLYRLVEASVQAVAAEEKVTRIEVRLSSPGAGKTALRVSGDGRREEAETAHPEKEAASRELRDVAERAVLFGGEYTVRPGERGGTVVQAVFHEPAGVSDRRD